MTTKARTKRKIVVENSEMISRETWNRALRREPWAMKIPIKQFLHREDMPLRDAAQGIADIFRKRIGGFATDPGYSTLERIATAMPRELDPLLDELVDAGAESDVEWFDGVLSGIYDFCDTYRIWCQ